MAVPRFAALGSSLAATLCLATPTKRVAEQLATAEERVLTLNAPNEALAAQGFPARCIILDASSAEMLGGIRALQPLCAVELLVANQGRLASPVKAVSRRRRGPQARLYRAGQAAIIGHRVRRLATTARRALAGGGGWASAEWAATGSDAMMARGSMIAVACLAMDGAPMRLIRLLNHCHHFPGFVYTKARLCLEHGMIEIDVRPRRGSRPDLLATTKPSSPCEKPTDTALSASPKSPCPRPRQLPEPQLAQPISINPIRR